MSGSATAADVAVVDVVVDAIVHDVDVCCRCR